MELLICCLFYLDFGLFFWLWSLFYFLWGWSLKFWLIKPTLFELSLTHKTLAFNPLWIIIGTLACILEIHQPLERDNPCPLFIGISSTEIKHILKRSDLKARWNHILFLSEIAFVGLDLSEIDKLCQFFKISIREYEYVVHGKDHPPLPPLL